MEESIRLLNHLSARILVLGKAWMKQRLAALKHKEITPI
jgi:hypothetical protein